MKHIKSKVLGVLVAVLALGVAVGVPSFAAAEGEVQPLDASCQTAHVCAWSNGGYTGAKFERACEGIGTTYNVGFTVGSLKTRCGNPIRALGGFTNECFAPVTDHPSTGIFSEMRIVSSC